MIYYTNVRIAASWFYFFLCPWSELRNVIKHVILMFLHYVVTILLEIFMWLIFYGKIDGKFSDIVYAHQSLDKKIHLINSTMLHSPQPWRLTSPTRQYRPFRIMFCIMKRYRCPGMTPTNEWNNEELKYFKWKCLRLREFQLAINL